ncbi:hypothetical protein QVD17_34039 [Tagetes erecta]|uniref:Leucine-rich repeat-containing N-terminal plant-type domain-containing protein n=1 Tax=Tagetes erecta TaxID=13708 RepID=A0AAD8NLE9_TARER|nr:hypothetical protein QVD17_34039 [Tagetes erecta]
MKTSFLVICTFFSFFQRFGLSIITSSSNVTCIKSERQSLLVFKNALTRTNNRLSTWTGIECCEWHGVECDRNGHVVKLDLRTRGSLETIKFKWLTGEFSPSLQNLKHLRYLDVSMNGFTSNIPKFLGSFERLEYLNLSGSSLGGVVPHHLGNLSRLQYLDLTIQILPLEHAFDKEPILDDMRWVSSLTSLRHLDLTGMNIGEHVDWFNPVNMLSSLLTLNLGASNINIPSIKYVNFTSLNTLGLSSNSINSNVPMWLSNLTALTHLDLSFTDLRGQIPDYIGTFNALSFLDLSVNHFENSIPDVLCNLSNLVHLDLSVNKLSGPIPSMLGLILKLEDLSLQFNKLSGNISTSLGQLSNLKQLDLSGNSFAGVLSEAHFAKVKKLNYLDLSRTSLVLNITSQWTDPFQLQTFYASSCNVVQRFPYWLQTQTKLQRLDISNSSIIDTIPDWFENISSNILELDLSKNQIGGKMPRFHVDSSKHINGRILNMNSNKFEGSLATFPSNVRWLDFSNNLLSGHVPPTNKTMNPILEYVVLSENRFSGNIPIHFFKVPSIRVLDLSYNLFSGHLPQMDGTMNSSLNYVILSRNDLAGSLVRLCNVSTIRVLDLSHNKFVGRIPRCLGNLINLEIIDLTNNTITGVVPSPLGHLYRLTTLHLHNNTLEGDIPSSLQNLTRLVTMDLGNNLFTGTIPLWIGEKLSKLSFLNLQSNKLTGNIPVQLCQLNALQYLSLANNNITGKIPPCFGNLSGMITHQDDSGYDVYNYEENILAFVKGKQLLYTTTIMFLTISLDLSSNNIVGEIPDALMNLVGLMSLNLSRNLLKGYIPMNIGDLTQLESLDLSMNKLSGRIPQSLTSLTFLSFLNLSFNNLSGAIPVGNQLQTLDDASVYEGNDGLCGPPVSKSCKGNETTYNDVDGDDGRDETKGFWFYAGMGPGFVVAFMGFLGSLHFIKRWRVAYFKMVDNVYTWLSVSMLLNLALQRRNVFK